MPPRISSYQRAAACGSSLMMWTWSNEIAASLMAASFGRLAFYEKTGNGSKRPFSTVSARPLRSHPSMAAA